MSAKNKPQIHTLNVMKEALSCWDSEASEMSKSRRWISALFPRDQAFFLPDPPRGILLFSHPVDRPDLREENSIQAGIHTSPPLLFSTQLSLSLSLSLSNSLSTVGIATGVREGTVVFSSDSLSLCFSIQPGDLSSIQTGVNCVHDLNYTFKRWNHIQIETKYCVVQCVLAKTSAPLPSDVT